VSAGPLRVACIGIGWWSDVLADAIQRSGKLEILSCYTRSAEKRDKFAAKYRCRPVAIYEAILADGEIEAIINTTPNDVHLTTTSAAAAAGKHVFLDKPIANTIADGRAITEACRRAGVVLALGYQRRRESHFRWIKQQIDEAGSASSSTPRPTLAATASARSISPRGATRPPACPAA
jgi:predicted dehydrogenase